SPLKGGKGGVLYLFSSLLFSLCAHLDIFVTHADVLRTVCGHLADAHGTVFFARDRAPAVLPKPRYVRQNAAREAPREFPPATRSRSPVWRTLAHQRTHQGLHSASRAAIRPRCVRSRASTCQTMLRSLWTHL